jgi:hypothetical protein
MQFYEVTVKKLQKTAQLLYFLYGESCSAFIIMWCFFQIYAVEWAEIYNSGTLNSYYRISNNQRISLQKVKENKILPINFSIDGFYPMLCLHIVLQ